MPGIDVTVAASGLDSTGQTERALRVARKVVEYRKVVRDLDDSPITAQPYVAHLFAEQSLVMPGHAQ